MVNAEALKRYIVKALNRKSEALCRESYGGAAPASPQCSTAILAVGPTGILPVDYNSPLVRFAAVADHLGRSAALVKSR
jgi:hypothetical protein